MAVINYISNLLSTAPTGLWPKIVDWVRTFIPSYAWAILFFTLVLKLILSPVDYFQKRTTRKNAEMQKLIAPEMEKIQKKYGNNKQLLNQKQMELYKKNNYNLVGSCLIMLISLALTLVIFITLWSSLNKIANYTVVNQYEKLETIYTDTSLTDEQKQTAIEEKYSDFQKENSWLWVGNIWMADNPFKKNIPSFKEYSALAGLSNDEKTEKEATYNAIMDPLREKYERVNGYFILPILVVVATVFSQLILMPKKKKKKEEKTKEGLIIDNNPENKKPEVDPTAASGKIMLFILPVLMGWITLSYNVIFALYIFASSIFTLATTPLINLLIDKFSQISKDRKQKKLDKNAPSYKRQD